MSDVTRDINLLVQVARVDAALNEHSGELARLPARIRSAETRIESCDEEEARITGAFDDMKKERRALEQKLQDDEAKVVKFKADLMNVKSNKEYAAAQREIALKEEDMSREEERLLELMDAIDAREGTIAGELNDVTTRRDTALAEKKSLEERQAFLESEVKSLEAEKPKLLSEVATVTAVGRPRATSPAKVGPESTAMGRPGSSRSVT